MIDLFFPHSQVPQRNDFFYEILLFFSDVLCQELQVSDLFMPCLLSDSLLSPKHQACATLGQLLGLLLPPRVSCFCYAGNSRL